MSGSRNICAGGTGLDRGERAIPVLPPQPEQQVEAGSGGVDPPRVTQSVGDQLQPAGQLLRRRVVLDQVALQQRRERDPHRQAPRAFAGPGSVRCRAALLERRPSRSGCGRAGVPVVLQARAAAVLAGDDQRVERLQSPGPLAGLRVGPAGSSDMSTRGPAGMLTCGSSEPAVGFEPTAYRLQAAREPSSRCRFVLPLPDCVPWCPHRSDQRAPVPASPLAAPLASQSRGGQFREPPPVRNTRPGSLIQINGRTQPVRHGRGGGDGRLHDDERDALRQLDEHPALSVLGLHKSDLERSAPQDTGGQRVLGLERQLLEEDAARSMLRRSTGR